MLISKVSEEGCEEGRAGQSSLPEYQTASELFDLMTKNTRFDCENDSLSAQDLILLYQNMDIGTRLMSDANELAVKKPNQYVETVVYNDQEDQGSDSDSEMYTNAEIHDVFAANQERLDFLNNNSLENLLCHKFGGITMHTSDIRFDYDKQFFFQDPYIKSQLRNLNVIGSPSETDNLFSTSLIDYICCKRLEDNYNFYMDNIIRYVQHTIEQLKRISNGDYLTERAKEKWREVISSNIKRENDSNTKVLATSTSIPLHVERKAAGKATWDDLVRSEVDVRSLSKILEKKIIIEIPKLLCGSYRLYSKRCADNLIIRCQKECGEERNKKEKFGNSQESRVDVVLQLKRSQTGQVISNISSIMVLKTTPALPDIRAKEMLPLLSTEETEDRVSTLKDSKEYAVAVIEIIRKPETIIPDHEAQSAVVEEIIEDADENEGSYVGTNDYPFSERHASLASIQNSSEFSLLNKDSVEKTAFPKQTNEEENNYNIISPHELQMTMRKLDMRNKALEESAEDTMSQSTSKKRSPVRVRIKSPYENKSFVLEEKKRKRLLEIRERRERKKLALSESCKIKKHKYGKGAVMPQASSSVTKLSITNRSFYNSIYGQNSNMENKSQSRKLKITPEVSFIDNEDCFESPMISPDKNSKKYINRSYYLDDAETEMTYMQRMKSKDIQSPHSTTNSLISNDFNENLDLFKQLITPSETNLANDSRFNDNKFHTVPEVPCSEGKSLLPIAEYENNITTVIQRACIKPSGDECRKSIDQLYDLIKQFGKPNTFTEVENNLSNMPKKVEANDAGTAGSEIQGSESGSSVKHSPEVNNFTASKLKANKAQPAVAPKVVISSKQSPKVEADKAKRERNKRVVVSPPFKGPLPENPLKAISQLLRDFENVQKNKQKPPEAKSNKKVEIVTNDTKSYSRQGFYRRKSRLDQHRDNEIERRAPPGPNNNPKDKKIRHVPPLETTRILHQHNLEERNYDRIPKKKISDIIDEAKEARGEAVRGPSKFISRLESLAQPKKSYVQAHHEEYQTRYGRNMIMAERLQKLATTHNPGALQTNATSQVTRNRWRRNAPEVATGTSVKQRAPSVPLLDQHKPRLPKKQRSASSSPDSPARRSPRRKHSPTIETTDCMGKKIVAVESYAKNNIRGSSREERQSGMRCRVPLVPHDIEIASLRLPSSVEEATSLGNTLHHMIDSVVRPGLAALAECAESVALSDPPRSDSDYCVNILEDKHITTAVSVLRTASVCESLNQHPNSTTELEQLESALYSHMSGSFQKRLRIKNLTLTPKPSVQQMFLLQSGDAGSVLMKSVSNIKLDRNSAQSLHELKALPVLSKSRIDWTYTQIPMQIATVGYAFTKSQSQNGSGSKVILTEMPTATNEENFVQKACQSSQCFRGINQKPLKDASAQVDVVEEFTTEVVTVSVESHLSMNPEVLNGKESLEIYNETHISSIFSMNEIRNEDNDDKTAKETDAVEPEESNPSKECSDVLPVAPAPSTAPSLTISPEYTTSLDMLVGLLNEIQKITYQNQITASDHQNSTNIVPIRNKTTSRIGNISRDLISMSSLDNLRQLESSASIFTYYVSNDGSTCVTNVEPIVELKKASRFSDASIEFSSNGSAMKEPVAVKVSKPVGVDKEVSAKLCEAGVDICTSVPSCVVAIEASCEVDVNSVPSSQSIISVNEYHTCSNILFSSPDREIVEIPQIETSQSRASQSRDKTDLNEKCLPSFASIRKIENIKRDKSLIARCEISKYCVKNIDLDPMFKIKRDILVSVYSILVLTVFAALSFPELLIFQ